MALIEEIKKIAAGIPAELKEHKGIHTLEFVVAERKAFLSKQKLTYSARFRIDEAVHELRFTEMLKEAGSGLVSMGDSDMSPGFGFKAESYNTMSGSREGTIKEQSVLFGKKYQYQFDYGKIREQIEKAAVDAGYGFRYLITPVGL